MIGNVALREKITLHVGAGEAVGEGGAPVSVHRVQLEDRTLKSCCKNAVAISVMTTAVHERKMRVLGVDEYGSDGLTWHEDFNSTCRDVEPNKKWLQ